MTATIQKDYLAYFGLSYDPFVQKTADIFSPIAQRLQSLEKIEHLIAFSELNVVLSGQKGVGKTCLVQQFLSNDNKVWLAEYLLGSELKQLADILAVLMKKVGLSVDPELSNAQMLNKMVHCCVDQQHNLLVLVIDDAEQLSDVLYGFLKKVQKGFAKYKIQLKLIFVTSDLTTSWLQSDLFNKDQHYELTLLPLNLEQSKQYLQSYCNAASIQTDMAFDEQAVQRIFELSRGIPSEINRFASDYMQQTLAERTMNRSFPNYHLILIIVVVFLILMSFYWQFKTAHPDEDEITLEVIPVQPSQVTSNIISEKLRLASSQQLKSNNGSAVAATGVVNNIEPLTIDSSVTAQSRQVNESLVGTDKTSILVGNLITEMNRNNETLLLSNVPSEERSSKLINAQSTDSEFIEKTAEHTTIDSKDTTDSFLLLDQLKSEKVFRDDNELQINSGINAWLFEASGYTLQLMGSFDESKIQAFIEQQTNKGVSGLRYFKTDHQNKAWYVVSYGLFANKQQALSTLSQLPEPLAAITPWLRTIESIQQQVLSNK